MLENLERKTKTKKGGGTRRGHGEIMRKASPQGKKKVCVKETNVVKKTKTREGTSCGGGGLRKGMDVEGVLKGSKREKERKGFDQTYNRGRKNLWGEGKKSLPKEF